MICPACNTEFPHGTVFCNRCHVTLVADLVEADEIVEKATSATSVTWQRLQNTVPCGNSVLQAGQIMTPESLLQPESEGSLTVAARLPRFHAQFLSPAFRLPQPRTKSFSLLYSPGAHRFGFRAARRSACYEAKNHHRSRFPQWPPRTAHPKDCLPWEGQECFRRWAA